MSATRPLLSNEIILNETHHARDFPDVFVISPFSEVAYKLKTSLYPKLLFAVKRYKPNVGSSQLWEWLNKSIGTVHTFQGKQAAGVILCLGLDDRTKGAALWASQKPNLLNVALTRAKHRFAAVGDQNIWLNKPYFRELKKLGVVECTNVNNK
ncbi:AAA domain-containing protein [Fulvivirga ulvae]|uniref:AAA domain-containing protein n=1 Tax=Fulvivirga ulvae TaxID=2904245 RepID=UPI001F3574BB|nr:AAA domain-containing protein [Fulvivirga ulvae]UII32159.1 AAA domain-containing protein [Fulvivirga ulvae]